MKGDFFQNHAVQTLLRQHSQPHSVILRVDLCRARSLIWFDDSDGSIPTQDVFSLLQDGITQVLESHLLWVQLCWSLSEIILFYSFLAIIAYYCCMKGSYKGSLYPIKDGFPAELNLSLEVVWASSELMYSHESFCKWCPTVVMLSQPCDLEKHICLSP